MSRATPLKPSPPTSIRTAPGSTEGQSSFPGNITESYRTRDPFRIVAEVETWEGYAPDVLQRVLDNLAALRQQGLDVIED